MSAFEHEPLLEVAEALIESGGRDLLDCLQCGTCSGVCPYGLVRPHSVRRIIRQAALGLEGFEPLSWLCLTCRACVDRCPQQIDLTAVMQAMRTVAAEAGGLPPGISAAVGSLSAAGNPWGGEQSRRFDWAADLPASVVAPAAEAELLYFTCCTPAYDPQARRLARNAVTMLHRAGHRVALVGDGEVCCGDLALRAGRPDLAHKLARQNLAAFARSSASCVVTSSPHCWQAFQGWYGEVAPPVRRAAHVVELLHEAWQAGRFPSWTGSFNQRVAYHDPCYLGRHAGLYDPPRELLRAVPGLELVELRRCREHALCCGGGGGGAFRETPQEERHALLRIDEALEAGVTTIVTACPLCWLMFEDARRVRGVEDQLQIRDLCDILSLVTGPSPQEVP